MNKPTTLADCKTGDIATLYAIEDEQLSIQLCSMGFIPGENIRVETIAPLGDPILISADDSFISIRKADAASLKVKKVDD